MASEHELELTATGSDTEQPREPDNPGRQLAPVLGALVGMAVLIIALLAVGGDDAPDAGADIALDPDFADRLEGIADETEAGDLDGIDVGEADGVTAGEADGVTAGEADGVTGGEADGVTAEGASGDPNFPPSDEHLQEEAVIDGFVSTIESSQNYLIAYPADEGIKVITADGVITSEPANVVGFQDAEGFPMFGNGEKTWAVDGADPGSTWIVSRNYEVVDIGLGGAVGFVNYDERATVVGVSSFGSWGPGFTLPIGTDVVTAQGIGLLVLPETGGTLIVTPTGLEPFSDDRVVAATDQRVVVQRCDELLNCGLFVVDDGGDRSQELPIAIGTDVSVSPDGQWVLAIEPQGPRLVEVGGEGTEVAFFGGPASLNAVAWAPDSSFVAWLVEDTLHLVTPAEQRAIDVVLSTPPSSSALLVTTLGGPTEAEDA